MKFEQLKATLIREATPVKRLATPQRQFLRLATISTIIVSATIFFLNPRDDFFSASLQPTFWMEGITLLLLAWTTGTLALKLSIPGNDISRGEKLTVAGLLFIWITMNYFFHHQELAAVSRVEPGYICSTLILGLAAVFAVLIYSMILNAAPLKPVSTGFLATLFCSTAGAIALHFICPNSDRTHLLIWHVIPVAITPSLFTGLYRRYLRF